MPTDIRIIKNIRKQLEDAIRQAKQLLIAEGVDINDPEFKRRIKAIRERILEHAGINPELYQQVNILDEVQTQMREAKIGMAVSQQKFAKGMDWSKISNVPEWIRPFNQSMIRDLKFSQLLHKDTDHIGITNSLAEVKDDYGLLNAKYMEFKNDLTRRMIELSKQIIKIPYSHGDLKEIGENDHHSKLHSLETHIDSDLMKKLKRLVSGDIVDDLHKHKIQQKDMGMGGLSSNDLYVLLDDDPESLSSQLDGATTVLITDNDIHAVIWLSLNGSNLILGTDFTVTGTKEITLSTVTPDAGEELFIKYF